MLVPFLEPLAEMIYDMEADTASLADAFWAISKLDILFSNAAAGATEIYKECSFAGDLGDVYTAFKTRRTYGWDDSFTLAALLHPAHRNKLGAIDSQLRHAAEKLLISLVGERDAQVALQQLVWWREKPSELTIWDHNLTGSSTKDGVQWWKDNGSKCTVLQKAAMKVLSIPPSAAGGERNFSVWHHIFSDDRASMRVGRVGLLVYIYANSRMLNRAGESVQDWNAFLEALDLDEDVLGLAERVVEVEVIDEDE